jgi:murein hydrolase activator
MNKKGNHGLYSLFLIPYSLFLLIALSSSGQNNKKELERKKEQIRKDIEMTNKMLDETKNNKKNSISHLITLTKKINYRNELINTIGDEIVDIDGQMTQTERQKQSLEVELDTLKRQYARMVQFAYKNQSSYSRLMFIFASADFNQAYKRIRYLQEYSDYRKHQRDMIVNTQDSLAKLKMKLQMTRTDKSKLLTAKEQERLNLTGEKEEQEQVFQDLSKKEKELRDKLKEKQKEEARLSKAIENIINKEIEAAKEVARRKALAAGKKKPAAATTTEALTATPEALKLSTDFEDNRGKLPWPVDQGFISSSFGRHAHPVWKNVETNNNGVDIASGKGSTARAVFDGTVSNVVVLPGYYAVLVQHGEFFTLYSNLDKVFVKAGDKLTVKQALGTIKTDDDDGKTEVHLEIWKGSNRMDPELWLSKR